MKRIEMKAEVETLISKLKVLEVDIQKLEKVRDTSYSKDGLLTSLKDTVKAMIIRIGHLTVVIGLDAKEDSIRVEGDVMNADYSITPQIQE